MQTVLPWELQWVSPLALRSVLQKVSLLVHRLALQKVLPWELKWDQPLVMMWA
jgi:hypothetical protein